MENSLAKIQQTEIVLFNQTKMVCPIIENEPYVVVKSIIDGIGLNYNTAIVNLKNNDRLKTYLAEWHVMSDNFHGITCQILGLSEGYSYTVLPVRKVAAWLYGMQVNSVKEPAKSALIKFQDKCDDVLYNYFFGKREIEQNYIEEKKILLSQKKELDVKIKALRTAIHNTPDGKELEKCDQEMRKIKFGLQRLEQKQFGMVYTLFDQLEGKTEVLELEEST